MHSTEVDKVLADSFRQAPHSPGETLSNGSTIIDIRKVRDLDTVSNRGNRYVWAYEYKVLAVRANAVHPYVIWVYTIGTQQMATGGYGPYNETFAGEYYKHLNEALADWMGA